MSADTRADIELGQVKVNGKLFVTDPCYVPSSLRPDLTATLDVEPGLWEASIETSDEGSWGVRVARLCLTSVGQPGSYYPLRKEEVGALGVDSGQMMIATGEAIADWVDSEYDDKDAGPASYAAACDVTLNDPNRAGVFADGRAVVSSSGYGDGVYPLYAWKDGDGTILAVEVEFIGEEEEDEEEEWEEEEEEDDDDE